MPTVSTATASTPRRRCRRAARGGGDGSRWTLAFTLAFARDTAAPGAGFEICPASFPKIFWNPAFKGASQHGTRIAGVCWSARETERPQHLSLRLVGERGCLTTANGISVTKTRSPSNVDPSAFGVTLASRRPRSGRERLAAVMWRCATWRRSSCLQKAGSRPHKVMGRRWSRSTPRRGPHGFETA